MMNVFEQFFLLLFVYIISRKYTYNVIYSYGVSASLKKRTIDSVITDIKTKLFEKWGIQVPVHSIISTEGKLIKN